MELLNQRLDSWHCSFLFIYLFIYKFIYFNWRLITLQYCIAFAIHQHESATCVHMFPTFYLLNGSSYKPWWLWPTSSLLTNYPVLIAIINLVKVLEFKKKKKRKKEKIPSKYLKRTLNTGQYNLHQFKFSADSYIYLHINWEAKLTICNELGFPSSLSHPLITLTPPPCFLVCYSRSSKITLLPRLWDENCQLQSFSTKWLLLSARMAPKPKLQVASAWH